ncbi:glycosyltransferase involved in cell wall biosynthesis [Crossiella equi]|uniref:Glycosyltransferase involved in cell wall biosynthesis n=1 Tax=Crossiella equi TaxID=130796 RepID=A0ABS5AS33_9PSEU|nr:glycosyltransferase [Crossiella equi]MBP2479202.1 glycosyltransferase involved in cell wall biosynthesis [Crossiella equi]
MNTALAVLLALLAAALFAFAVARQHAAVRAHGSEDRLSLAGFARTLRSRTWLTGTALAVVGSVLHVVALALAPMVVVQPIGVLSLVLTVLLTARARRERVPRTVRLAVLAVCAGVLGVVALAAIPPTTTVVPDVWTVQGAVLVAVVLALVTTWLPGRARCAGLAIGAAVLFGLGSVLMKTATAQLFTADPDLAGLFTAGEAVLLLVLGGWLSHQAYAAGPAPVVVGAVTVIDPLTAVAVGLGFYGEAAHLTAATATGQAGLALLAVLGVGVLARSVPERVEPPEVTVHPKEHVMPASRPRTGRPRLVIAADTFPPDVNGAANFAGRLAHGLAARGYEVHVLCPSPTGRPGRRTEGNLTLHHLRSAGTPFHPDFRICLPWRIKEAVADLLVELAPDVVHTQSHFPVGRSAVRAATTRSIPVVATNHFMPENLFGYVKIPGVARRSLGRAGWADLVRVYRHADVVTAPTPRAVELLRANKLPGSPRAISCGIDIDHYARPVAGVTRSTEASVLFVGRLDAEKNVHELIQAAARVPGLRVELVGDGSRRRALADLAADAGVADRVHFLGCVSDEDLVRAYQRNTIFCMPGTAELQSLATMEAMAAGLPVVAADAMALPHLAHPGVNGHLFPPGDIEALTACLAELAGDPALRAEYGAASRRLIEKHALSSTVDSFAALYREVATPRRFPALSDAA